MLSTTKGWRQTMKRARIVLTLSLSIMMMLGLACDGGDVSISTPTPTIVSTPTPVTTYISLIDNLREAGAVVEPRGEVALDFLSAKRRVISVNDSNVQVWEYDDAAAADAEAALISPNGSSVRTATKFTLVDWIAPPHFYKASKLIVLYVGDNQAVIDVLETVLGSQFAGS
jgi:hypothetical protein